MRALSMLAAFAVASAALADTLDAVAKLEALTHSTEQLSLIDSVRSAVGDRRGEDGEERDDHG